MASIDDRALRPQNKKQGFEMINFFRPRSTVVLHDRSAAAAAAVLVVCIAGGLFLLGLIALYYNKKHEKLYETNNWRTDLMNSLGWSALITAVVLLGSMGGTFLVLVSVSPFNLQFEMLSEIRHPEDHIRILAFSYAPVFFLKLWVSMFVASRAKGARSLDDVKRMLESTKMPPLYKEKTRFFVALCCSFAIIQAIQITLFYSYESPMSIATNLFSELIAPVEFWYYLLLQLVHYPKGLWETIVRIYQTSLINQFALLPVYNAVFFLIAGYSAALTFRDFIQKKRLLHQSVQ